MVSTLKGEVRLYSAWEVWDDTERLLGKYHQAEYDRMVLAKGLYAHCNEVEDQAIALKENIDKRCIAKGFEISCAFDIADEYIVHNFIFI